jgi:heterodisulfide reductase subunit A-like polyferredoxin
VGAQGSLSRELGQAIPEASQAPVGAVLVVGGGIAGMQASLDLADQGYRVHLVEAKSAIGGHMAQLDKTFPTNDCAMCTISPKLVETGRHLNIDLHVDTEVVRVDGQAGDFAVTLRRKPRYIDTSKCVGCGDCAGVCPVVLPDRFNENLSVRRAAFKLYPQAVPNAFAIEKLGVSPCRDACPAGQRAQGYIALIREARYADALRVIKEDNPFPGICGRICNHRCEDACNRRLVDDPVNIHSLKRFVTDSVYSQPRQPVAPAARTRPERVAIIGAGPCGLTAAQDLARLGYGVTIFEALPVAGGMLRVGVPEYRLPAAIIEREIADILDLGVELRLNTRVDDLDQVFAEGFASVLIAVGAHEGVRLPIPGADLDGVLINTHFLRDVRLDRPPALGRRVLVLGGGNVAIDVARSAVRLGAEVHLACLEPRAKMLCHPSEAEAAEAEGVTIHADRTFVRIVPGGDGKVAGVECRRVSSFTFDHDGRLSVETEADSEHVLEAETVIFSVGQRAGLAFIPDDAGVGVTRQRTIAVNPNTMAATRPGVFAAGDSVSGTAFVIEAVASGHRAAESIQRYLQGEALERKPKPDLPVVAFTQAEALARVDQTHARRGGRVPVPELPVEQRRTGFAEVESGYTDELAQAEAARCLACARCSECLSCVYACGPGAIDHDMVEQLNEIHVGAVVLAPGFEVYRAELSEEFGLGRYPNVVTALQFERLLSASGPTAGHVVRPSDGQPARRIAFLQCIGSRDQSHDYCSAVCCMYATKEAVMAREHDPQVQAHVFMMDMRAFSKGYSAYYERARETYGVAYVRCRISALREEPSSGNLLVRYAPGMDEPPASGGSRPAVLEQAFDLVVLSVGMEMSPAVRRLAGDLGVELDDYGFCHTMLFDPVQTSRPGIYAAGPFREPKDIPETVVEASAAAADAAGLLAPARHRLTRVPEFPAERDVIGEAPRVGVFVCHCGSNIGGFVDVPSVAEYAGTLPNVVHAEHNLYTCSQDSIARITERIKEYGLNRVVVSSCTPRTHAPLFEDSLRSAGLNPALFDMANIRNHCSWVHSHDRPAATEKARDLVRMAVARVTRLEPLSTSQVPVQPSALVLGGGAAGMTAALSLARGGFDVDLVERQPQLGGNLRHVYSAHGGQDTQACLEALLDEIGRQPRIRVHLEHELETSTGFVGNFTTSLRGPDGRHIEVHHGVTLVATGGREYRGDEYLCGSHASVITGAEFEALLARASGRAEPHNERVAAALAGLDGRLPRRVATILCVGPAERTCARICCTTALKNALTLKQLDPQAQVTILYRDLRTYGFKERLYTDARRAGVVFIRYEPEARPEVSAVDGQLQVRLRDPASGTPLLLEPELLVLSNPVIPAEGARTLATRLKLPLDADGFFLEAHVKLRPVDFSTEGVFMAGMAHYPKLLDESIVQAKAAASRAARILSQPSLTSGGAVAQVDPDRCVGCLTCVRICPFGVPQMSSALTGVGGVLGAATIEATTCRGCGTCVAECPAKAIQLAHYRDDQLMVKLEALLAPTEAQRV